MTSVLGLGTWKVTWSYVTREEAGERRRRRKMSSTFISELAFLINALPVPLDPALGPPSLFSPSISRWKLSKWDTSNLAVSPFIYASRQGHSCVKCPTL